MKKIVCVVTALLICISLACPVFAAGDTFTASVGYKDAPQLELILDENGDPAYGVIKTVDGEVIGYIYEDCIVITPVSEAETSEQIPEEAAALLLELYQELTEGTMELPYSKINEDLDPDDMVIRDLFDISLLCEEHPEMLEGGNTLELIFDLDIDAKTKVYAMIYVNGEWVPVDLVNNGDGTVTGNFTAVGPVAFSVETKDDSQSSQTGDTIFGDMLPWALVLLVCGAGLIVMTASRRKAEK